MLFMGEEWGSKAPFPFFCDFKGGLAEAVRKGRRDEYAWAYGNFGGDVPDPLGEATFRSAILDWEHCPATVANGWRWCESCSRFAGDTSCPRLAVRALRRGARGRQQIADEQTGASAADARLSLTANLSDGALSDASGNARAQ